MRLDVLRRLKPPASPTGFLLRTSWKFGLGVGILAVLLTAGGVDRVQPNGHALATNVLPTTVPCGPIATDPSDPTTATWTAITSPYGTGSPYNLPVSTTNNTDPTVQPCDAIVVPHDVTLKIDASQGPVQIFSHGAAIKVDGGHLLVLGTSETNSVLFDAEPDVASWIGITVNASDSSHRGNASLAFASIQHALNSITITSGATSTPDPTNPSSQLPYGLAVVDSGIGPSYFDGIDVTNTPVLVKGQADGKFGTVNNIGNLGIKLAFDGSAPSGPANALNVEGVTFGSSVPFAATGCLPFQLPCSAGFIGNDAILATFTSANPPPVVINHSRFFRAGAFGIELNSPVRPVITNNNFDCNGVSAKTRDTCVGSGLHYSAIYLNAATVDLENSVTNNVGHENGLDAIVLNGTIVYAPNVTTQKLTWKNATNDASTDHALGYLLNGDLNFSSGTLVVPGGSVVKSTGAINLTGATLDASDTSDSRTKVFTSLRDNATIPGNTNIQSCPSIFVQSCPSPLAAGEWGGINLTGSATDATIRSATTGTITNAAILYATTGVHVLSGSSLTITASAIGPTFADGVLAQGTPLAVRGTTFGCPVGVCGGPSSGNHGILADLRGVGSLAGGLKVGGPGLADGNTFQGSVNEAIRGVGLTGQVVDVEGNKVANAGATGSAGSAGIYLQGADNLTLKHNNVVGSGTGNLHYPAIWLDGVSLADFNGPISNNSGSANGLDAIAFHGDSKALAWQTIGAGPLLGYLVDGNLTVKGAMTMAMGDNAPVLGGTITVTTGGLNATGALLTSLKEQLTHIPSCGSVFVPKVSGVCPPAAAGDWNGLVLDPGQFNSLTNSEIRFPKIGITMDKPTASPPAPTNLVLVQTNIRNAAADGIATKSPLSVSQGAFTNLGGRALAIDLGSAGAGASLSLDRATIQGTGADGVQAIGLAGQTVSLTNLTVDHAGAFGIDLQNSDDLTLQNNTVTHSAATYPAIYLNGFTGPFANISGNRGASNGVDAIAFHGIVVDDLPWKTARKTNDPSKLLGYIIDGNLTMQSPHTLTVNAGDIVKVGNGGVLNLQGVSLKGDDTASSSQKIFTSLTDDGAGVATCHSVVVTACSGPAQPGDWGGISLSGNGANGALVNTAVRYASTGILITSQASSTFGSSVYGLVVSRSSIGPSALDDINAAQTSISVSDSTISGGTHGVTVDDTAAPAAPALRVSGNRFMSTSAEAVLGRALSGRPVWITDNHIQGAGAFGIRLLSADQLVLRNNNISGSGGGPTAGAGGYPAIYLGAVSADFVRNVRGNVGSGNALDVIAFHGTANGDVSWRTPSVNASTAALGYVLDGSLTVNDGTFTVHPGDVVKSLGGPITVKGGTFDASIDTDSRPKVFTSLRDTSVYAPTCPSILTGGCTSGAQPGDWGGVVITNDLSGHLGSGSVAYGDYRFASTALTIDSGPKANFGATNVGLIVKASTISDVTGDGVNAQDTPVSVKTTTIQRVGAHGIVATFLGGTPCTSACATSLDVENVIVISSSKDGIVASGLGGRPTIVSANTITGAGTYGIRLADADQLTLNGNTVTGSGGPTTTFRYPAIYLGGVKADFELTAGTSTVARNHGSGNGLDAVVFHGEATQPLTWLTTGLLAPPALPLVPADHLGYVLDGGLTVDGNLTTNSGDAVKVLMGTIKVNGGVQATGTAFTSLKDGSVLLKACDGGISGFDSVFVQRASGACPAPAAGDWSGITASGASVLTSTTIAYDDGLTVTGGTLQFSGGGMHDIARNAIVVNGSSLSVTNAVFARIGNDAIDSVNSGATDIITDDQFDHVAGVAINLQMAPADLERNTFTNDANPVVKTSGSPVSLQCSSIQSGGITGDAGLTVKESDFAAGIGVSAPAGASAENNWWGQGTGPSGQLSGGVAVTTYFTTQNPTATIAITGKPSPTQTLDPAKADGSLGTGLVHATVTFSRNMNTDPSVPVVGYASSPVNFTGFWKVNDPRTWSGDAPIDSSLAPNGTHTVSASGARDCVPDPAHNLMTPASSTFMADTSSLPNVAVSAPDLLGAHSVRLHGHIAPNGFATGAVHSGQFVLLNTASPFDSHTVSTPPVADKTTPFDFTLIVTGLNASATYAYQLQVPSVNGTAVESTSDTVSTTGVASQLAFTSAPPSSAAAGEAFATAVAAEDGSGNLVSDSVGSISLVLTLPNGATLSGTQPQGEINGVATFTDLSVNQTGSYTLTATSSPALTPVISGNFTIHPSSATKLVFKTQPTGEKSTAAIAPAVTVAIEDGLNNVVTGDTSTVTVSLASNVTGGTLSGTLSQAASGGIATFNNLSIDKVGSYTLGASDGGLAPANSNSFGISLGPATQLVFTTQPSSTATAGVAFALRPVIVVEDAGANVVTTDSTTQVTVVLTIPNGATLSGTTTQIVSGGFASFGPSIDKTGTYTLTATSSTLLTPAVSGTIAVQPAAAATLQVTALSAGTAGVAQTATVTALDAFNNIATGYTGTVHFISTDGQAVLPADYQFTVGAGNDNGTHTFTNGITLKTAGSKTVTATDTVTSTITGGQTVVISPAAAAKLLFTIQPSGTANAGAAFAQQPGVSVEDGFGNVLTNDNTTSVGLALTTPGGATLSGTATQTASSGVATFSALSVNKTGSYTLTATSSPVLTSAVSSTVTIQPGAASQLVFTTQPSSTQSTAAITPAVTVAVEDSSNNVVTGDTSGVTVALASNVTGGVLSGTLSQAASAGIATFNDLSIDKVGSYTLGASDGALTSATSTSFSITLGPAAQLAFTTQPSSTTTAGVAFTEQPGASVEDAGGNVVAADSTTQITLALTSANGAVLSGTTTLTAAGGVASFSGVSVNKTGSYTLTATSMPVLTSVVSNSFAITPAAASQLVFTTQPSSTSTAGVAFAQQPGVSVEDAFGNVVTNDSATSVSLALTTPGGAILAGSTSQTASSGVATFSGLSVNKTGSYTLTATSAPLLPSAGSNTFTIQPGAAAQLAFVQQPTTAQSTAAIAPAVTVAIEDSFANVVTSDTRTITVSLASNLTGGTLSGTLSQTASAGVASFGNLSVDKVGSYALGASGGLLTAPSSSPFSITFGPATQLVFTTQPSSTATNGVAIGQQPAVSVEDASGNVVTTDNTTVITLGLAGGALGAKLTCTTVPPQVTSGVATFAGCSIDLASFTPYQVTASGSTSATAGPFPSTDVTVS